jgi:hypothetical protein
MQRFLILQAEIQTAKKIRSNFVLTAIRLLLTRMLLPALSRRELTWVGAKCLPQET